MKYLLSFLVLASYSCSSFKHPTRNISSDELGMEYVKICRAENDCKKFSRLVMGTDHLVQENWRGDGAPELDESQVQEILDEAMRLGINLFDTSPIYVGGVEHKLGRWIEARKEQVGKDESYYDSRLNPDRKLYTLSKGGFPFDLYWAKKLEEGANSKELRATLEKEGLMKPESNEISNPPPGTYASRLYGGVDLIKERVAEEMGHTLRNLNNDITIYLMHRDDGDFFRFNEVERKKTPVTNIMKALSSEEISSKFWMLGWSNWKTARVNQSLRLAKKDAQLSRPIINSPYFSLFEMTDRSIHAGGVQVTHWEMMHPKFQKGIKIMPYSPLGGFSIFDRPEPIWENAMQAAKKLHDDGDPYWQNVYPAIFLNKRNKGRFERVTAFTEKFNKKHATNYTIDQMINAYALAHPRTDFLAIGPTTIEQLRRTVASLKLARMLTAKDLNWLHTGGK